jgi:nitronate monooxygenase
MSFRNSLTDVLNISIPVIQAPMAGGGDTAELVSAVSNAGAIGFIGAAYLSPEQIIERGRAVRAQTSRPFGINLFAPTDTPSVDPLTSARAVERIRPYFEELELPVPSDPQILGSSFDDQFAAALETGAVAFSFAFGLLPLTAAQEVKRRGMFLMGTATTVKEAQALVEMNKVDAVVAQGSEAGGHRSTFGTDFSSGMVGVLPLVPQIADAVEVPVIASGGIMDGRGIGAALVLGASAAQMGTAFLTCSEAGIAPAYKDAILGAAEDETRITRAFSGRPARGIGNRLLRDFEADSSAILPFPLQNVLTRPLRAEATKRNRSEYLSLWAGQGLRMARRTSAAELVAQLERELSEALESVSHRLRGREQP